MICLKNKELLKEKIDIIFSSGALQYVENPIRTLEELVEIGAEYVFISRVALSELEGNYITVQESLLSANGPGKLPKEFQDCKIKYPVVFAYKKEFENVLARKYEIIFNIKEDEEAYLIGNTKFNMFGYFCKIKS